jgi:quinohemoprotein ethanol dehydrogenase
MTPGTSPRELAAALLYRSSLRRVTPAKFAGSSLLALCLCISGCGKPDKEYHQASAPHARHVAPGQFADDSDGRDWPGYGRTYGEQHYSPLKQINASNVGRLGLAWAIDLPPGYSMSQPIAVQGVLYVTTGYSVVRAINAVTGQQLWSYDPGAADIAGERLRFSWGTRGLTWWNDKIYIGTVDGRLIALNAKTGQPVWTAQTYAKTDQGRYITGAPRIFNGMVVIGHGGADVGPVRGYVTAYDAETGEQKWRFWTVPGDPAKGFENDAMQLAAKTWSGEWWRFGGGGTVWNAITYDAATDTLFLGTGNGAPHNHRIRSAGKGDNLFLSSIVALEGQTGSYKWHYQTNPGETWDYNAAMDMALADLRIGGRDRKVLMTAPKNGFFYVIDRQTGKLISAKPFAKVTWASRIDIATGRPVEDPAARFADGKTFELWPGSEGAHNWAPMAFNPITGLAYIPVVEFGNLTNDVGFDPATFAYPAARSWDLGVNYLPIPEGKPGARGHIGLIAWDPVHQRKIWSVPADGTLVGGLMTTAGGLVFGGRADGTFSGYAADTGRKLWSFEAGAGVLGAPITYIAGGKQYITVISGVGGINGLRAAIASGKAIDYQNQQRRILTFVLDAQFKLASSQQDHAVDLPDPGYRADAASEKAGAMLYARNCLGCHGIDLQPSGQAPDLRHSLIPQSQETFASILHDGSLVSGGMPMFKELSAQQTEQVRQYIRAQAKRQD